MTAGSALHSCRLSGIGALVLLLLVGGCSSESEPEAADPQDYDVSQAIEAIEQQGTRLARVSRENRRDPQLVEQAAELVERYPDFVPALRHYGQTLLYHGQLDAAVQQFQASLELDPDDSEMHHLMAGLAMQQENFERAARHYAEAVELSPHTGRHRVSLGIAQTRMQEYERARHTLLEALQMDSSLHSARAALADLYARQGQLRPAMEQIRYAIDLVEDSTAPQDQQRKVNYVRQRARLLRRDNQPDAALSVLRELPPEVQFQMQVAEEIADTWAMLGLPEMAGQHYEYALMIDESNDEAAARSAHWFLQAGELERAGEQLRRLRQINPRHPKLSELEQRLDSAAEQPAG